MNDFFEFLNENEFLGVIFFFGSIFACAWLIGLLVSLAANGYGLFLFGLMVLALLAAPVGVYLWRKHND